jgi:transcriptional regulator with XRE-family HTH domain
MNWIAQPPLSTATVDFEILQESALAIAQATIQNAMDSRGLKPSELAEIMGKHRPFVSRLLRSNHNMTIKTFALALAACGYRAKFGYAPPTSRWARQEPPKLLCQSAPASAGSFMRAMAFA